MVGTTGGAGVVVADVGGGLMPVWHKSLPAIPLRQLFITVESPSSPGNGAKHSHVSANCTKLSGVPRKTSDVPA